MKLSDLKPEEIYIGMRIITAIGNFGTITKCRNQKSSDIMINDCVNTSDDDTVWFDVDGDDGRGHAVYLHDAQELKVISLDHHIWCNYFTEEVKDCKMCSNMWKLYPYNPETLNTQDLMSKHFPGNVQR